MIKCVATVISGLISLLLTNHATIAGDVASVEFVGFTDNGVAYYLEHGRQDGSGFPYATLARTSVAGGAVTEYVLIKDESAEVETARTKAAFTVTDSELRQGQLVLAREHTDASSHDTVYAFYLNDYYTETDSPLKVNLTLSDAPAGDDCYGFFDTEKSVSATLVINDNTEVTVADALKPSGCIRNVRLGRVYATEIQGKQHLALLLMVNKLGFEGDDVRWLGFSISIDARQ